MLLTALATPLAPTAAAADTFGGLDSVDAAKRYFNVDGSSLPQSQYQAIPQSIGNGNQVDPKQLKVVVCARTGSDGSGQCTNSSPDAHVFSFSRLHHEDLGDGSDFWDYSFSAPDNDTLRFLYRVNPGQASHWGLVYGDTDEDVNFSENKIVGLEKFGDTDLARKVLEERANEDGLAWARQGGIQASENQTGFLERQTQDPFMMAAEKATEAINSLNDAISSALLWAIEASNPNEVSGLADAWKTIKDLVNILFMVVLVALALMTIGRIDSQKYNVRSLLPLLVFAVITVNFSFLFATVLVNTSYVLSQPFLESAREIIQNAGNAGNGYGADTSSFGAAIVMLLAALLMLVALIILLFFFVIRIIVIWLLSALSPVVCLFMVLPLTRGEAVKLLETGVKWVYMAPIAFLILYIGSEVGIPDPGQGDTADAILSALFYGGLIVAAVIIPIGLGGQVMRMASGYGSRAAKIGGKGGLGAAAILPAGGGKTLGQRAREGRAFMRQRGESQEAQAQIDAAQTRLALADSFNRIGAGGLTRSVTGMSEGQQVAALEAVVGQAQKEMVPLSLSSKMRIANAYKYGTRQVGGQTYANTEGGGYIDSAPMDAKELALAGNRINAAAAFRELGQAEFIDPHLLEGSRNFAWTGYQQLHKTDPVVSSYERVGGRVNMSSLRIKSQLMSPDDLRGLDGNVIQGAMNQSDPRHRYYLEVMRNIDSVRLGDAVNPTARNKMHSDAKREQIYEMARAGMFSRGLTGDEHRAQREKEKLVMSHKEKGSKQFANP